MSHVFYVPNPTQPQGHGTYSPYNEIFRNIPVLISFDDLLRHRFLRIESQSDLRQRHRRKSDPYDRRPQIHQCHFPLHDQNQTRFDETVVKAEAPSYTTETVIINKNFNAVSVINLLDILGWGIDAATGAMTKPEFKFYQIDFQPKEEKSIKQD